MLYIPQTLLRDLAYTKTATLHEACLCVLLSPLWNDAHACVLPSRNASIASIANEAPFSCWWHPMQNVYGSHGDTHGAA